MEKIIHIVSLVLKKEIMLKIFVKNAELEQFTILKTNLSEYIALNINYLI